MVPARRTPMQTRFASSPKPGIRVCTTKLWSGRLWNATMHRKQLSAYRMNVPKLDVRVMVSSELGIAASLSCVVYPKLEKMP